MSDYTKSTNFAVKDGYTTGDPRKVVKGTEIDTEFNAIASAIASKVNSTDPVFSSVDINGGTIDNTAVGASTPSTGSFTTVTVSSNTTLGGTLNVTGNAEFNSTGQIKVPRGTTGQRANNKLGSFRYNDTTGGFEGVKAISGVTISSITNSTLTATLTTATAHGLTTGNFVVVSGAVPSAYNGEYAITVTSSTEFTYTMATTPAGSASTVGSYVYGLWGVVGGGATGGLNNDVFYENSQTISANYTITSGKNAMSTSPVTINSGVTVTVPSGSRWVVL
jgi:hypothetical protein